MKQLNLFEKNPVKPLKALDLIKEVFPDAEIAGKKEIKITHKRSKLDPEKYRKFYENGRGRFPNNFDMYPDFKRKELIALSPRKFGPGGDEDLTCYDDVQAGSIYSRIWNYANNKYG